jgi:hypothetical protein
VNDHVTEPQNQGKPIAQNKPLSLPFDPATLTQGIRVRPAEFSRMCEVSRQTVSRWVKNGVVLLFPDGTLDPAASAKRVIGHTDPGRMRARIFKDMTASVDDWRQRALLAEAQLEAAQKRIDCLDSMLEEYELTEKNFTALILDNLAALYSESETGRELMVNELLEEAVMAAGVELGVIPADDGIDEAIADY